MTSLVADIGGTNTRVALAQDGHINIASVRRYKNTEYPALWPIITEYLDHHGLAKIEKVCVCAAGPVHNGVVSLTNLAWMISEPALQQAARAKHAVVLNDLAAQGYALSVLSPQAHQTIIHANAEGTSRLVIGMGTGVNAAAVHSTPNGYFVPPSEAGHITLPTPTPDLSALRDFIARSHGLVTVEEILSGRGVSNCYAFAAEQRTGTSQKIDPQHVMQALNENDPIAIDGVKIFVQALAAFASDLALIHLPYAGIHLVGGVSRAISPWLTPFGFKDHFCTKGRFSRFMQDFPVSVINDDYAALSGCAAYLVDNANSLPSSSEN